MRFLVYLYYTQPFYRTSTFGQNHAYCIGNFMVYEVGSSSWNEIFAKTMLCGMYMSAVDQHDDDTEAGTTSTFTRHPAVHHNPRHAPSTYGSTSAAAANLSEEPSGVPSSDVHVTGRRHRSRRTHRSHNTQTQRGVEDV